LMSLVSLAANTVALAVRFKVVPDKAAMVVVRTYALTAL